MHIRKKYTLYIVSIVFDLLNLTYISGSQFCSRLGCRWVLPEIVCFIIFIRSSFYLVNLARNHSHPLPFSEVNGLCPRCSKLLPQSEGFQKGDDESERFKRLDLRTWSQHESTVRIS